MINGNYSKLVENMERNNLKYIIKAIEERAETLDIKNCQ